MRYFALAGFALLGSVAVAGPSPQGFVLGHQSEAFLLHRRLDPERLRKLDVWDTRLADWRSPQTGETVPDSASLIVLHLWADYCAPCRDELPFLRQTSELVSRRYGSSVRWLMLSETSSASDMRTFLGKYGAQMPAGTLYLDSGERIADALRPPTGGALSYPVTVVLDSRRVVRHAIVGRLTARRIELLDALDKLLALERTAASSAPGR